MKQVPIKAYTVKEMCALYGVSRTVFFSWIKKFRSKIGELKGKTYTPKQVRIIFDHLEMPEIID
jgi:transposase-like protein